MYVCMYVCMHIHVVDTASVTMNNNTIPASTQQQKRHVLLNPSNHPKYTIEKGSGFFSVFSSNKDIATIATEGDGNNFDSFYIHGHGQGEVVIKVCMYVCMCVCMYVYIYKSNET